MTRLIQIRNYTNERFIPKFYLPRSRYFHASKSGQGKARQNISAAGVTLTKVFTVTGVPVGCCRILAMARLGQGKVHGLVQQESHANNTRQRY